MFMCICMRNGCIVAQMMFYVCVQSEILVDGALQAIP